MAGFAGKALLGLSILINPYLFLATSEISTLIPGSNAFLLYSLSLTLTGVLYYPGDAGEAMIYQVPSPGAQALEVTTQ